MVEIVLFVTLAVYAARSKNTTKKRVEQLEIKLQTCRQPGADVEEQLVRHNNGILDLCDTLRGAPGLYVHPTGSF